MNDPKGKKGKDHPKIPRGGGGKNRSTDGKLIVANSINEKSLSIDKKHSRQSQRTPQKKDVRFDPYYKT